MIKNPLLHTITLILLSTIIAFGQQEPTQQNSVDPTDEPVVRINTDLVQVDVIATDEKGRLITDLRAEDFEILEDGQAQTVTNFSYINVQPTPQTPQKSPKKIIIRKDKN